MCIVGCGNIAETHGWALTQMKNIELVGFADIIPQRAKDFSRKYTDGRAGAFSDLNEMLEVCSPNVLHICTPHYLHVPMAIEALSRNISVFSEKPPAINMQQFKELESILDEKKRKFEKQTDENNQSDASEINSKNADNIHIFPVLGFCFQNRYNKTIEKADEILQSGSLGKITGARAFVTWRRDEDYYKTDWKGKLETEGGGALINQAVHTLDLLLRYLGKPDNVQATVSNHHLKEVIEVEDTVEARMTFPGGARACFYASTGYAADAPVILELQCEKGSITILDQVVTVKWIFWDKPAASEINLYPDNAAKLDVSGGILINADEHKVVKSYPVEEPKGMGRDYWGSGHLACISDFYSKMESGERFRNDLEGVRNTMETMMRIYSFR